MKIFAKITNGTIETSDTKEKGYEEYTVNTVEQLNIKDISEPSENPDEETKPEFIIEVTPFQKYKANVLQQINNVFNYLTLQEEYEEGTKARRLLDEAKTTALENVTYLQPPVTTKEEEEAFPLELAKEDKFREIKLKKKALQSTPVKRKIGKKMYTFFGGVDAVQKYSFTLALCPPDGKIEIRAMEGLVMVSHDDLSFIVGTLSKQAYGGWLRENKLLESIYMAPSTDVLEKIDW